MSRRVSFNQSDITRAVRGVQAAGLPVAGVIVDGGKIEVIVGYPSDGASANPLDRVFKRSRSLFDQLEAEGKL